MGYDEQLAERIRKVLDGRPDVIEKKMFGGLTFMVRGHMACGIVKDELMVRVGAETYEAALERPHARPMDFTGRPMKRMIYVAKPGFRTAAALRVWVDLACASAECRGLRGLLPGWHVHVLARLRSWPRTRATAASRGPVRDARGARAEAGPNAHLR